MEKCNKAPRCVTAAVSPTKELIKTQSNKGHPLIVKKASVSSPGWHRPVKTTQAPYLRLQKSWKDATVASFILLATWVRVLSLAMKTTHPIRKEHDFTLTNYD